ncbi:hypothetical protein A8W25_19005 [Streptomyces sp. ERV7]|uniref:hypothetical protein n=1 Tax=Streptomyces sp. ERV7 TaxID=1322334 RepID=UPI0007F3D36F|nr:hypothetical protein [Streptomyces sp. ERV7]OAR24484.1 hypothetical protein A8W25_19005 [Streptomyces sp. ERV7]
MARNQAGGARRGRVLLRAGLTATAAGAALAGAAGAAQAADGPAELVGRAVADPGAGMDGTTRSVTGDLSAGVTNALAPAKTLSLNPFAKTSVDPLDNAIGTEVADFKPISTAMATGPLHESGALKDFPVIGAATRLLPG